MTTQKVTVKLAKKAHEMAQEEIGKQVAFLSKNIGNVRFLEDGAVLCFDAPAAEAAALEGKAAELCQRVQRGLRSLERKILFQTERAAAPVFRGTGMTAGIHLLGPGQVALSGVPLRLFRYFDRAFTAFGALFAPQDLLTPTLIPSPVLARCDYFRSFPHNVTFAAHLPEDAEKIADFRSRHQERDTLDDRAIHDMGTPEACLSPAVCYHVYSMSRGQTVPRGGAAYAVCGKCFRYESSNMNDLRRLWDFTMREVVFLGSRDVVLGHREEAIRRMGRWLEEHGMAAEVRTASDPFFIAPDAVAKTYFQISSETKYEISLFLPDPEGARLAAGSFNYHTDFFGKAFDVAVAEGGPMHSVCVAFGLERWVYAFLAQHGDDPAGWPEIVRHGCA